MNTTFKIVLGAIAITASPLAAQSFSVGLRGSGSIPTGSFAQAPTTTANPNTVLIEGAKSGFGYGLDVSLGLGAIAVYAGFDHVKFDCEEATCRNDGKYTLQGVTAGVKLSPSIGTMLRPFAKAGVTFNDLEGSYGGSSTSTLTTERTPGYEIGVGADITLGGIFAFTPQARYVGQELKAKLPGINAPTASGQGVNYFSFDLGFSVRTPFGAGK